ncbi:GH25 family lysozyme [Acetilactobacillus jinshanensis]|uniref:1,4-beta-N-acetylmuramidase n=1 Tax=Acetilactobacillus jinshanensis TaxID=1720083 RepID=A0A4P6ZKU5_9LACO|nr:GH25 family lysozyme [Acetilactobacillus jinshanensis]QBP18425.1 hypothetical protein ELX58_04590 [Acetilactobacillus jinshanensis]URL61297.1 hypothetical protein HGK75_04695 [uncultured bacterium]
MVKDHKLLKTILWPVVLTIGLVLALFIGGANLSNTTSVNAANAYDISGWQGYINNQQAGQLKHEVNFMILKAEQGGLVTDNQFNHNAYEMQKNNIPYGAYDYSVYANPAQASAEAKALYQRAPQANFYVNDSEENLAGSQYNASTQAWANEIHQITTKPAILYSGSYFMNTHTTPQTRNAYDGLWVAQYGPEPNLPYHYDLWQYTDSHYSPALRERVDASVFPDGANKPMSFWTGKNVTKRQAKMQIASDSNAQPKIRRTRSARKVIKKQVVKTNYRRNNRRSRAKITYNPNYYRSKRVHLLQVTGRHGINLYTLKGKFIGHVNPNVVLTVVKYITVYHKRTGYMTKAVGIHHGHLDLFTSNKKLVTKY